MYDISYERDPELVFHPLGRSLHRLYHWKRLRRVVRELVKWLEPDTMTSGTIRNILRTYHQVSVGTHSYGCCLIPGHLPPDVVVGRYVSMARHVSVFRRNHPLERLSLHPYFYNAKLGVIEQDNIESVPLEIGHDAWIAEAVRITPGCRRIGIGAVVGTGAVVTKDVPDFAVVAGVPAKVVKHRFEPGVQKEILESRWWEKSKAECARLVQQKKGFAIPE